MASVFSVASVWVPAVSQLHGYAWLLGALMGAVLHYLLMRNAPVLQASPRQS